MKTVLITGANRGIGFSLVKRYLEKGCRVFACCRNIDSCDLLNETNISNKLLSVHKLDVTSAYELKNRLFCAIRENSVMHRL